MVVYTQFVLALPFFVTLHLHLREVDEHTTVARRYGTFVTAPADNTASTSQDVEPAGPPRITGWMRILCQLHTMLRHVVRRLAVQVLDICGERRTVIHLSLYDTYVTVLHWLLAVLRTVGHDSSGKCVLVLNLTSACGII